MIESLLGGLPRACIRRPGLTLAILLCLVALAAPGLLRLRLRTDGHALVPGADPAILLDASIREHFDLRDPIILAVVSERPEGIYNLESLQRVQQLSAALAAIEEIGPLHVMSLATERRDRVRPGSLDFRTFLEPLPTSPELMEQLRSDIEAVGILHGSLVSFDSQSTTILVGVPASWNVDERMALYQRVMAEVEAHRGGSDRILASGSPVAEMLLGQQLIEDLALLVPLSVGLIAMLIWVGCRRIRGVVLALAEVGACLIWTFGWMGWCGVPVYLTIAVLPVILTTIGLADEIHIFWHYQRTLATRASDPHPSAVRATMDAMLRPVVLTSLTSSIGFLAFMASTLAPVRAFGLFAAVGISFCMVWSLTFVPAALTLIDPRKMRRPVPVASARRRLDLDRLLALPIQATIRSMRYRRCTLGLGLLISALATIGLVRLHVQDSWIGGFASHSPFRQATDLINAGYHGVHLLLVQLAVDVSSGQQATDRPLSSPNALRAVGALEQFLRDQPQVGGVLGPHAQLSAMHYLLRGRKEGTRVLPHDARATQRLIDYFDKVRGSHRRRGILDDEFRRGVVTVFLEHANYRDTARLIEAIRDYARIQLDPLGLRLEFGGDVAVSQAMIPAIVRTQITSLLLAIVTAAGVLSLLLRSLRLGVLATLPALFAALCVLGMMGWSGIPLGVATSMFCAITIGIGVDYGIHFVESVRRAGPAGVRAAVREVGPAIVVDSLAIALGFGLLALSRLPANARLGLLVALGLSAACVLTLFGLSALLGGSGARRDVSLHPG